MEPQDLIQQNIYEHGRIQKVRLLSGNDYAIQFADGHAEVVTDPRTGSQGPIKSLELSEGPDQMLTTNFADLWSTAVFAGPDGKRQDEKATLPNTGPAAKRARELHHA